MGSNEPQLRFFGGAHVNVPTDGPGRAAHRRRLALLAILACSPNRAATRDKLIGLLWAETTQEKARRALSESIYVIRREFGESALRTEGAVVTLGPGIAADVAQFRTLVAEDRLEDAVALYVGPFLDGWYVEGIEEFERWTESERGRLHGEYRTALTTLANRCELPGQREEAIRWLRRLVDADPLSTGATIRLSRLLGGAGERGDALQLIERHRALLASQYGVRPADELLQVETELKRSTPAGTKSVAPAKLVSDVRAVHENDDVAVLPNRDVPVDPPSDPSFIRFVGLVTVAVITFAALLLLPQRATAARDRHHIAVLYFDDHSEGRQLGFVADGLTEALIHELAAVPALRVSSRHSVKPFRRRSPPLDSIASLLQVGTIIEGSVERSGTSLRVTAQVIDATTGLHDSSLRLDAPNSDLFQLEEALSTAVGAALRRSLGSSVEIRTNDPLSEPVRRLVQQAKSLHRRAADLRFESHANDVRSFAALLGDADSLLERAERLEPRAAIVQLLRAHGRYTLAMRSTGEARVRALTTGMQALGRMAVSDSRDSSDMLYLRGSMRWALLMDDMKRPGDSSAVSLAERDLRQSVAIDSAQVQAWATLSQLLLLKGAYAEAENAAQRALNADSYLDGAEESMFQLFVTSIYLGRFDDAQRWCQKGQLLYPRYWRFYECELTTMRDLSAAEVDSARAWQLVAIMDTLDPPASRDRSTHPYSALNRRMMAAAVSARLGDVSRARRTMIDVKRAVSGSAELQDDLLFDEAYLQELLGERANAVSTLRRLLEHRPFIRETLLRDPFFAPLRDSLLVPVTK